jgi:methylated-DNA-protein-cysteine methyltransferase related protein
MVDSNFRRKVYEVMERLPSDKVTTYGDVAAMAGSAYASRVVGGIAHFGDPSLPWHRLVNRFGGLASAFPGGREVQEQLLFQDNITCTDFIIDNFKELRWKSN